MFVLRMRQHCRPAFQRREGRERTAALPAKGTGTNDPRTSGRLRIHRISTGNRSRYRRRSCILSLELLDAGFSRARRGEGLVCVPLQLLQKRLFVVDGRRQQSWSMVILWRSRAR